MENPYSLKNRDSVLDIMNRQSVMRLYNITKSESAHTAFLFWLFSERTLCQKALALLIKCYFRKKEGKKCFELDISSLSEIKTEREVACTNNSKDKRGFADIVIHAKCNSTPLLICIENKVLSKEHDNQTKLYAEHFNRENPDAKKLFIFLTPLSHGRKYSSEEFVHLTYQNILTDILQKLDATKQNKLYIDDYITSITTPEFGNDLIMAITEEDKNTLTEFWNENATLIRNAARMLSSYAETEEQKEEFDSIANQTSRFEKYQIIDKNGSKGEPKSKRSILKEYINEWFTGDDLDKKMEAFNTKVRQGGIVKLGNNAQKDRYMQINNTDYYFKNEIGGGHWENLLKFVENNPTENIKAIQVV